MIRLLPLARFVFVTCLLASGLRAQELRTLRDAGPTSQRVNIVIFGDGYTENERAKFFADAKHKIDVIVGNEAFTTFAEFLNGFAIFVASNESGADIPYKNITRDTYFNTSYGTGGIDRLLTADSIGRARVNALLRQHLPDYDIVVMVVNSTEYGGAGGFPAVTSLASASDTILLHELGHSFAGLADEYVDEPSAPNYPPRTAANISQTSDRNAVPWAAFLLPEMPVPTTGATNDVNSVGVWEGAYFRAKGFYRPIYNSKMRSNNRPFGPVNLRAFADAFHRLNIHGASTTATLASQPADQTVAAGSKVVLSVAAQGTGPFTFQWSRNGKFLAGETNSTLVLSSVSAANAGTYRVEVSNARGKVLSQEATISLGVPPAAGTGQLINLSARAVAGSGGESMIAGFYLDGAASKNVLIRAIGPSLAPLGVDAPLDNPRLELQRGGVSLASNDDWAAGGNAAALTDLFASVGAFPLNATSRDAAILATGLAPGAYTARVSSASGGSGIVLIEVYDAASTSTTPRLINLSSRVAVGRAGDILIAGFAISGSGTKRLLLRAAGPALQPHSIDNFLARPRVALFSGGTLLHQNSGWGTANDPAAIASAAAKVSAFAFPPNSADAALLVDLAPGSYTAQVSGVGDTTGVALMEVYEVP